MEIDDTIETIQTIGTIQTMQTIDTIQTIGTIGPPRLCDNERQEVAMSAEYSDSVNDQGQHANANR